MTLGPAVKIMEITVEQQRGVPFLTAVEEVIVMCLKNHDADIVLNCLDQQDVRLSYWELMEHIFFENAIPFHPKDAPPQGYSIRELGE